MNMNTPKNLTRYPQWLMDGTRVRRIKGDAHDIGALGTCVELDIEARRVRVKWDDRDLRTWIKIECVELA